MKKQGPKGTDEKRNLPAEYLSVDYLPPTGARQIPVRGGKRAPNQTDKAAEKTPTRATQHGV